MPASTPSGNSVSDSLVQIGGAARPRLPEWARKGRTHFESLNTPEERTAPAEPAHRLRVGALPQHPRVLPPRRRHVHDSRATAARAAAASARCPKAIPRSTTCASIPRSPPTSPAWPRRCSCSYVVITSVNRDDLDDGGSHHFAETVREVRRALPRGARRSADARFLRRSRRRRARARRRPARLQSQHGDRAATLPPRAPAGRLPAVARRAGVRAPALARRS